MVTADIESTVRGMWGDAVRFADPSRCGTVTAVSHSGFEAVGMRAAVGEHVVVVTSSGQVDGAVVALDGKRALVAAYGPITGLTVGLRCCPSARPVQVPVGTGLLGRVINALGEPIDGNGPIVCRTVDATAASPHPLKRKKVTEPFTSGVRAVDAAIPLAKGQRVGIFAGSGVGKSTLLSMMVKGASADVIVVGLVGERGREVREFIEDQLGAEGMSKSVVVVATGDEPALLRRTAAETATRIAEWFREEGNDVLLVVDSVTRFAMAQREIGLASGELPAARGYPPSVLSELPRLMERAGNSENGSMTALYTVLVDGDDMDDPIADAARGILDGHIVLSRDLANAGHFPAIDVLSSVSRLSSTVYTSEQADLASMLRSNLAEYDEIKDLLDVGAYLPGSNPNADTAIELRPAIVGFLKQFDGDVSSSDATWSSLADVFNRKATR